MLNDKLIESGEDAKQEEQHPVEILKTKKNQNSPNQLHENLSEKPDDDDTTPVHDQEDK
jgi:hypothetical protein